MSVAVSLGVDDVNGSTMRAARDKWVVWSRHEPALASVGELLELRSWTRHADVAEKDNVLRALAKIGSDTGGGDPAAVAALTWAMVPGAATIAYRVADKTTDVDDLVAGHLWISCKTFAWQHRRCVAASILRDTLRGVQAELGIGDGARRKDRAWSLASCHEPTSVAWGQREEHQEEEDATVELLDLLSSAARAGVISGTERTLLIDLATASDRTGVSPRRGRAGLMAPAASGIRGRPVGRVAANGSPSCCQSHRQPGRLRGAPVVGRTASRGRGTEPHGTERMSLFGCPGRQACAGGTP